MYTIEIVSAQGQVKHSAAGTSYAQMYYTQAYEPGDCIHFSAEEPHCAIQADATLPEALLYLAQKQMTFAIPFGDLKTMYAPQAFLGTGHMISLRPARVEELYARRNLALNPYDQRFYEGCYPHAEANVETRDEPSFFARNAIDGVKFNISHGHWPFHSWGIGGREDAALTLHFGRSVLIDEIGITLRADFPHDSWWEKGTLTLSDGKQIELAFEKTGETQYFPIGDHEVHWVRLLSLKKAADPSPFPGLTQLEAFGMDIP